MLLTRKVFAFLLASVVLCTQFSCSAQQNPNNYPESKLGLKDVYSNYFSIGVAITPNDLAAEQAALIQRHFNSVTA